MNELLFVVERRRPELYESLKRDCADIDNVHVILDRRQQARRRSAAWLEHERRQAERRLRKVDEQLTSLGFVAVKQDPPPDGPLPGAPGEPIPAETASFVAAVPLFTGLTREEVDLLAGRLRLRRLRKGQVLFSEGARGEEMFLVRDGRIIISKEVTGKAEEVLAVMEPGDFFGEMNAFGGRRRSASARAETDAVLIGLDYRTLEELVARSPRAGVAFFTAMVQEFSKRLDRTDNLVAEVTRWGLEATGLGEDFD
jgi:CRP/FNR family transcriptional regulator, cyclic AMP receptor protein